MMIKKTVRGFGFAVIGFCLSLFFGSALQAQSFGLGAGDKKQPELSVETDDKGALYLDFKGATLMNVLKVLSEVTHINFVAGNEIATREVNMSLDGVSLEQALIAIAQGVNITYAYIPETQIILFRASADSPTLAPLLTRVFKLYFLRAAEIREIDAGQSSSGGSSSSSGSGLQLISGSSSQNNQSQSSAATQDVPVVKIVENMLSERGSVSIDDRSNSLVVTDSEDRLDRVAAVIAELDRPLNQVLINVLLVETFEDLDRELGVEWANTTGADGVFGTVTGGSRTTKFPFNMSDNFLGMGGGSESFLSSDNSTTLSDANLTTGTKSFTTLNVQVKALQTASKLRILAKPNILVMDNHPAVIKIVTNASIGDIAVVAGNGGGGDSGTTTTQQERAEVGTILRVTPQINTQDQITMTIEPTFATVNESTITAGTGDPTVRAARTTLMVNSGTTMVMGGLMFSEHTDGSRKVPFLGDLPFIGRAFTSDDKAIEDRELVLFLTPQIIKNPLALKPDDVPGLHERFDDVNAQFWKFRKKTWYKNMQNGTPPPDNYDKYFQVRKNTMDQVADQLKKEKETMMNQEAQMVGAPASASTEGVKWDVR